MLPTDDCIVSIKNTQEVFRVVTKQHEISVYRDELRRPALIVQDGRSYTPKYDVNLPGKMTSIVSNDTGIETNVPVEQSGQTNKKFKELLATAPKLKDVMCKRHVRNPALNELATPQTENSILEESEGEDWAAIGFESEYATEAYWANEFFPEFEAAVNFAEQRDAQKACAQRWENCNGACDNVAECENWIVCDRRFNPSRISRCISTVRHRLWRRSRMGQESM